MVGPAPLNAPRLTWTPSDHSHPELNLPLNTQPILIMHLVLPIAAAGYSLVYLLFGGGFGGAVLIFIIAKMLGR